MSALGGDSDRSDRLTLDVVARAFPSQSFESTLAIAVPGTFDEARAWSFTAVTTSGWTLTVAVAWAQLDGSAVSQIR